MLARKLFPALLALALLTGCGASSDSSEVSSTTDRRVFAEPEAGAYPVTIEHALGETTISEQPQRVVVIGWSSADLAVQLGTVPVAQGIAAGIEDDHYPWFEEAVTELGAELPAVDASLERGDVDVEFVLAQEPDLILAVGSGITEAEYTQLSEIAPTVAYLKEAWGTSVTDQLTTLGAALGRPEAAKQIQADLSAKLDEVARAHPEFDGRTYLHASTPSDDGQLVVFASTDSRNQTLEALGLEALPEATALEKKAGNPSSYAIGLEQFLPLKPDLFVSVAENDAWEAALKDQPTFAAWAPVQEDRTAVIDDLNVGLAFSTSTPLGLQWGIDDLASELSEALA